MAKTVQSEQLGPETRAKAEELGLNDAQALELLTTAESERDVQAPRAFFRSKIARILLFVTAGIGVTAVAGGAALYAAKPHLEDLAVDIVTKSAEAVAEREIQERVGVVQEKANEFLEMANGQMLPAMLNFMTIAGEKLTDPERVIALAGHIYEGMKNDAWDYIKNDDKAPDKIIAELQKYIGDDPELNAAYELIVNISEDMRKWMAKLPAEIERQVSITEEDKAEALKTIREVSQQEIAAKWLELKPF